MKGVREVVAAATDDLVVGTAQEVLAVAAVAAVAVETKRLAAAVARLGRLMVAAAIAAEGSPPPGPAEPSRSSSRDCSGRALRSAPRATPKRMTCP